MRNQKNSTRDTFLILSILLNIALMIAVCTIYITNQNTVSALETELNEYRLLMMTREPEDAVSDADLPADYQAEDEAAPTSTAAASDDTARTTAGHAGGGGGGAATTASTTKTTTTTKQTSLPTQSGDNDGDWVSGWY